MFRKKSQKRQFIANFSIYFMASVTNKALPFFLLPILTRYLTPTEYGILAMYQVLILFCTPLVGMGMEINITREFFNVDHQEIAKLISNLLFVLVLSTSTIFVLLSVYLLIFAPPDDIPNKWLYSIPVISFMNLVNQFNLTILRNQKRSLLYGTFEILNTTVNVSVTLLLVVVYQFGWIGRASGILVASIIFGFISLIRIYKSGFFYFCLDRRRIREILKISIPLIPYALGVVIINMSDRFFIDYMLGKAAVGLYSIGYQFGMIILLITDTFNKVWSPWMFEQLASITPAKKIRIVKMTYFYDAAIVIIALGITIISPFLLQIMTTKAYHVSSYLIGWVALGYAFRGMYTMVFPYLANEGRTNFLGLINIFSAIINLITNYFFIKYNGIIGAAQATLLSYAIIFLGVWWYAQRIYPMPWRLKGVKFSNIFNKR